MDIQGYTWYIIWCMYMVYTWYIHGYSWIFLAFWNQTRILLLARAAGLTAFDAHTCAGDQECFTSIPRATITIVPAWGEKAADKGSARLPPTFPFCPLWRRWRRRRQWCRRRLSVLLVLLWSTTWILVKDGGKGAFRAGDQFVEQLRCLPALKSRRRKFYLQRQWIMF